MPLLRVLRGSADDDEIAALVTAIAAVAAGSPGGLDRPADTGEEAPAPRSAWVRSGWPAHAPGGWRASGLPHRRG